LQHLAHIGQLQRKHIKEATAEAETQILINNNKTLKARLAKANELYAQLKKETNTRRDQSKKWESDLSAKVRTYRDSEKTWFSEEDSLRFELQRTQTDYEHLKQIVEKAEAEQIKAHQRTRALEYELDDYGNVRRDLEAAQEKIMSLEDSRQDLHALLQERNDLRNDLEISNMRLNSRELERERSFKAYERRIMELETRLQVAERNTGRPGQLPSSVQQMLDSTLAASNAKLQQLKKTHYHLLEQFTELQMKYHELEAQQQAEQGRQQSHEKSGHLDFEKARLNRNASMSMRGASTYNSRYLPPLATEGIPNEEHEAYNEFQSPTSVSSPSSNPPSARPLRHEPALRTQRSQATPSPYPGFGGNHGPDFSSTYDASLHTQFQAQAQSSAPHSSGKSSYSVDTEGSGGKDAKAKVDAKSEVRYYGRGE
jgi:DNA repair exonuclease SbcCD ATPase subunit